MLYFAILARHSSISLLILVGWGDSRVLEDCLGGGEDDPAAAGSLDEREDEDDPAAAGSLDGREDEDEDAAAGSLAGREDEDEDAAAGSLDEGEDEYDAAADFLDGEGVFCNVIRKRNCPLISTYCFISTIW